MKILAFEYNPDKDEASYRAMVEQDGKAVVLEGLFMFAALAEDKTALHAFLERQLRDVETNPIPCPFCGGVHIDDDCNDYGTDLMQRCGDCGAEGPTVEKRGGTSEVEARAKAIRLWNSRAVTLTAIHE